MNLTDEEITEVDPITKQYPFLFVATGWSEWLVDDIRFVIEESIVAGTVQRASNLAKGEEARMRKGRETNDENDGL